MLNRNTLSKECHKCQRELEESGKYEGQGALREYQEDAGGAGSDAAVVLLLDLWSERRQIERLQAHHKAHLLVVNEDLWDAKTIISVSDVPSAMLYLENALAERNMSLPGASFASIRIYPW